MVFGGSGFPGGSVVKHPPANAGDAGDVGSIPGSGRSPGEGNGNPLQYSCLENAMESLAGYSPWGHKRVGHDLATKEQQQSCGSQAPDKHLYRSF